MTGDCNGEDKMGIVDVNTGTEKWTGRAGIPSTFYTPAEDVTLYGGAMSEEML